MENEIDIEKTLSGRRKYATGPSVPENPGIDGTQFEVTLSAGPTGHSGSVGVTGMPGVIGAGILPALESSQSPSRYTKIRDIKITELNSGYVVHVGCHQFAFHSKKKMLKYIAMYVENPQLTEEMWTNGELFKKRRDTAAK